MGEIIRVNLTNETIKAEPLNMQDAKLYMGGRGLGTKYYINEVDPKVDPLNPENNMIFMTGPLTGTLAACAGRYDVVAKAPLTGMIGACSSGGHFGPELKFAGYDGIIFEGKAKKPVYLYINDGHIELRDASRLWGKEVSAATDELVKETADDVKIACIGPAGEKLEPFAAIMSDKTRAAGRSDLGAVMGSKNLKAIAVRGTKSIRVAKQKEFLGACLKARAAMKANPAKAQGIGLEYAASNRGGCRVRGYMTSPEILGIPAKIDPLVTEGKAATLKIFQDLTAVVDSVGICLFTTFAIGLPEISEMFRTCTGIEYTDEEVLILGERIWNLEKIFNLECGFSKTDDALHLGLLHEPVTEGSSKGKTSELSTMLSEYYSVRGWDQEGVPTEEKKKELSLD